MKSMMDFKRIYLLAAFIIIFQAVTAQNGGPLLSHYTESRQIENQSWAICQNENNVMLFANRRGILTFDGQDWGSIPIPVIPYSLAYNNRDKKVYVGGDNNYGYLMKDEMGRYSYVSLTADSADVGLITKIIFTDTTVYFYGEQSISRHNFLSKKLEKRFISRANSPFTGMFITPRNAFINVLSSGLFRIESDTLFPIVSGYLLEQEEILFSLPYDGNIVLLGLSNGKLSLFDGIKFYSYQVKDEGYLKDNILWEGITVTDSLYAFSTLEGGALIIEKKSGRIRYTINYQNGLPDDEVFALGSDNNNGLWLSHQFGLTRAELHLPVANFSVSMYPGLKGNLITSLWHNNELYVATSEGIFYLDEVKEYTKTEVFVRNDSVGIIDTITVSSQQPPEKIRETQKIRKSIFSKIFGKKIESPAKSDKGNLKENTPVPAVKIIINNPVGSQFIKKTISKLKSVNHIYRKVEGLNEKCKQLVSTEYGILASTNKGLFNVVNHMAKVIVNERYINFISEKSEDKRYYIAASDGYFYISIVNNRWTVGYPDKFFNQPVYSIVSSDQNTLWAGCDDKVFRIGLRNGIPDGSNRSYTVKSDFPQRYNLEFVNDTVFLFAESGIFYFNSILDSLEVYKPASANPGSNTNFIISQANVPWFRHGEDWIYLRSDGKVAANDRALLKIFDEIISIYTDDRNIWVIDGNNQLFRISRNNISTIKPDIELFIKAISNEEGDAFKLSDIVFESGDNFVKFDIVAPFYLKKSSTQYQYIIDKEMSDWSKWDNNSKISRMIQPGKHILRVRAKDIWGNISEPKIVEFTVKAPFTQTTVFYLISLISAFILIAAFVRFREKQLKKVNRILEGKVKERTAEIEAQKQEITSSIEYASRIQMAMLPIDEHFKTSFSDHFVFFKPRDIVSGDFYWIGEDEKHIFFTVADCTGHGVPGAFMSTMGISTLNEIITNKSNLRANTVLNLLCEKTKTSLHQTGKEGEAADGMDVAFCVLHKNKKTLEYSGAYNPLFIFQKGEFKEYKADRMPIGIYYGEKKSFTNFEINVSKGDTVYIFSDGFSDQFGGPDGGKYKKSNFKKLLAEIYYRPMAEQRQIIENEFEKWRGKADQVDDITIIGVRI
jgi:serine phosphatase RsbU (regulator of sigma subunit)